MVPKKTLIQDGTIIKQWGSWIVTRLYCLNAVDNFSVYIIDQCTPILADQLTTDPSREHSIGGIGAMQQLVT